MDESRRRAVDGARIGRAHRLEQRNKMLARGVLVPFAVASHDFEQLRDGAFAIARRIQRQRQIVTRLMIGGIGIELSRAAARCRTGAAAACSRSFSSASTARIASSRRAIGPHQSAASSARARDRRF